MNVVAYVVASVVTVFNADHIRLNTLGVLSVVITPIFS
jgi:hypothetical protein